MFLGTMEEKVDYGYVAEKSQRQMYLRESRVAMIWNQVGRGGGEGREEPSRAARSPEERKG